MKSFGLTDKGKVRKDNQDCFIIEKCQSKACMIIALCDGMGGAKAGGIASQLSNKAFVSYIYAKLTSRVSRTVDYKRILTDACAEANGVSYEYGILSTWATPAPITSPAAPTAFTRSRGTTPWWRS